MERSGRLAVGASVPPFEAGRAAYHMGYSRDACPYEGGTVAAADWKDGWDEESYEPESGAGGNTHPACPGG